MAKTQYICPRIESAIRAYLKGAGLTTVDAASIYAGIQRNPEDAELASTVGRVLPCADVICESAVAEDPANHCGVWLAEVQVRVHTNADDTTSADHALVGDEVFGSVLDDLHDGATDINAYDDFTILDYTVGSVGWEVQGRRWVGTLTFTARCTGADIT